MRSSGTSKRRYDKVRIVVVGVETMCAEVNHLMSCCAEVGYDLLLQSKAAMVGGDSHAHTTS
jgi:hypothetical protein